MTSSGRMDELCRPWENSDPFLYLIPRLQYGFLTAYLCRMLYSASDSPTLQLLLTSVWHSMVPSVCPVTPPWGLISSLPPSHTILPTYGPLSRLFSNKLVCVTCSARQKPTSPVKGQMQSFPLPRCFPNDDHQLSTFCCNRHPWVVLYYRKP